MQALALVSLLLFSFTSNAEFLGEVGAAPTTRDEYCALKADDFFTMIKKQENRIGFVNQGGMMNKGTCWWHSRFQRAMTYLAVFNPNAAMPEASQIQVILKKLQRGREVVEIPGYKNVREFTLINYRQIQKLFNDWQKDDGIKKFSWLNGLKGRSQVSAYSMQKKMNELFEEVEVKKRITYIKLQVPGIAAHSWLVLDVEVISDGLRVTAVEPNWKDLRVVDYVRGWGTLVLKDFKKGVPYVQRTKDFARYSAAAEQYCRGLGGAATL